ncbi:MFS transporter [Paenibacillus sp. SC116]|uniref:staphylopine family metallophore export MFS transporter CntE n=1 Tax=Paenibacillus sp. SC116 TaxID=2968986 RepID=UPI00215A3F99|nr:MFS transporter [Paenibacillus sp. SC116]MCR8843883.1 MFS transporter [Paenibacillus sp. SC116]
MINRDRDNPFSAQAMKIYAIAIVFYAIVYMVLMIVPFYALSLHATKTDIGLIMGATMLTSMFARPVAGKLIDRYGAGRIFVIVLIVFAFSLLGYFVPELWMIGIVRIIQGIVAAFFSTAMEIITIDLLSDEVRGQGLSLYSLATMIPSTFGPAAALYLKDVVSMNEIFVGFVVLGIVNVAFALIVVRSKTSQLHAPIPDATPVNSPGLWKNRKLLVSSTIMLFASIANGAIFTFLPLHLENQQSTWGSIYFLTQTVVLVLCRFIGRSRIPSNGETPIRLVLIMSLLASAGSLLLSSFVYGPILLLAAVLNGIAFAMLYPALLTFVSFSVPTQARGFLLGLFIGAADFGFALGALVMGPLADLVSFPIMFMTCAALCFAACLLLPLYRSEVVRGSQESSFS